MELLLEAARDQGATVVLVTHEARVAISIPVTIQRVNFSSEAVRRPAPRGIRWSG